MLDRQDQNILGPQRNGKPLESSEQDIFIIRTLGHTCSGCKVEASLDN